MADEEESSPGTAAFVPDFDTGEQSQPLEPVKSPPIEHGPSTDGMPALRTGQHSDEPDPTAIADENAGAPAVETPSAPPGEPLPSPVQPVTVPGRYYYLKWWKFALMLIGVWIVAAAVGMVLFSWWYHATNKTPAVFVVLVYTVASTVGALMLAMIPGRPLLSALAIALSSAVFASLAAAAPLYGHYHCERTQHCIVGLVPY